MDKYSLENTETFLLPSSTVTGDFILGLFCTVSSTESFGFHVSAVISSVEHRGDTRKTGGK